MVVEGGAKLELNVTVALSPSGVQSKQPVAGGWPHGAAACRVHQKDVFA